MSAPSVVEPVTALHRRVPAATAAAAADGAVAGATSASLAVGLVWLAADIDAAGSSIRPWGAVAVVVAAAALWGLGAAVAAVSVAATGGRWIAAGALALGPATVGVTLDDVALSGPLSVTGQGPVRTAAVVLAAVAIAGVLSIHPLATLRRTGSPGAA